jgi:hypothetical protein
MSESKKYLEGLGHKAKTYFDAKNAAVDYIKKWNIDDELATDLIIISQVWVANLYNESIREQDIALRLNIQNVDNIKNSELLLTPDMENLQLVEVFERYIDSVT